MLRMGVTGEDLARSRFAISPLWELVNALRLLAAPSRRSSATDPWVGRTRQRFEALRDSIDLQAVLALHRPGTGPTSSHLSPAA